MPIPPSANAPPVSESPQHAAAAVPEACADQVHVGIACVLRRHHTGDHECPGPGGVAVRWR